MRRDLRRRLTVQFVLLFVALYFAGGAVAILLFASKLDASLDEELHELTSEALPAVEYVAGKPSLASFNRRADMRHDKLLSTIQVFDSNKNLLEEFGPNGHQRLVHGNAMVESEGAPPAKVRSYNIPLSESGKSIGYLQVQVSVLQRDKALEQIVLTMLALTPFLALSVAACGSWFAGNATRPVEETMALLRQFVMDAAHEINTPLAVIEASLQTLEDELSGGDASKKTTSQDILHIIERASGRMRVLGKNLIDLSKLESPQYRLEFETFSVEELMEPVVEAARQLAKSKNQSLLVDDAPSVQVNGHRDSLERMILNLLSNAVSYTKEGGTVKVSFALAPQQVSIIIADSGIGIPKESLPMIFERFYRVDSSRSRARNEVGCGLGLSIVKATLDRHKGSIVVTSELGKGSVFTVSLNTI